MKIDEIEMFKKEKGKENAREKSQISSVLSRLVIVHCLGGVNF